MFLVSLACYALTMCAVWLICSALDRFLFPYRRRE